VDAISRLLVMRARIFVLLLIPLLIVACGSKNVVGKYRAQVEPGPGDKGEAAMAQMMASAMTLELKADNTFNMTMLFPFEGTYTVAGDTVELTVTKAMGMGEEAFKNDPKMKKPMRLKIEPDGKTLTAIPEPGQTSTTSFKFVKEG
jgi:hypothetical protein